MVDGAAWVHVVGFILCGFLLLSMAVLPVKATRRSYLNVVLLVLVMLLELGFIIPLARQPAQCYNAITPNDQNTSTSCAFSGAFVAFGGMALVTWILIRALFMHLQICWDIAPGKPHFVAANVAAWTVTIALVSAVLAHAGVSNRFGGYCLINNTGSIPTYWGWLLAFGGIALILQIATFAYCIKVYLAAARSTRTAVPSTQTSHTSRTTLPARAAANRIRQVLLLQWRSLLIVALAIFTTAFVCINFIVLDDKQDHFAYANTEALVPWIVCMILTRDNEACLKFTGPIIVPERMVVATLFVLAFIGVEAFFLMCRVDVFRAWWELGRKGAGKARSRMIGRGKWNGGPVPMQELPVGVAEEAAEERKRSEVAEARAEA